MPVLSHSEISESWELRPPRSTTDWSAIQLALRPAEARVAAVYGPAAARATVGQGYSVRVECDGERLEATGDW